MRFAAEPKENPIDPNEIEKARKHALARTYPREELVRILGDYNASIGNQVEIERLKDPHSACIVTGQQLGLMGGPAYTILKAISCLLLARDTNSIPIFWLATEDHDIHEIDRTYLLDELGNLKQYHLDFGSSKKFVEDLTLTPKHHEVIHSFLQAVGMDDFLEGETSYARAMAKFLVHLFAGTGLVFLEPYLLRPLARDFFKKEISQADEIELILQKSAAKMENAPLKVEKTNLFFKDEAGERRKIRSTEEDWLKLIDQQPERFSTNVMARPVLQTLLIPTLSYVAGPNELAYHQQLTDYFQFHGCHIPLLTPRLSATFITPEWATLLQGLQPWDKLPTGSAALHKLNNALHPHLKKQERVLNFCQFQAGNLIQEFLKKASWKMNREQLYIYL